MFFTTDRNLFSTLRVQRHVDRTSASSVYQLSNRHAWNYTTCLSIATTWLEKTRKTMHRVSENSPWWAFAWEFPKKIRQAVEKLLAGMHHFEPLKSYAFDDEVVLTWDYQDRFALHLLWQIIRPVAKHIIPERSYHLHKGTRQCLQDVQQMLDRQSFGFFMRLDVKSYYASINHRILLEQLNSHFCDPVLQHYFEQIVNVPINQNAQIINPTHGIPRRSTLSPFFGAIYLMPLLKALQAQKGIECFLFMDDLLVLIKTKRQYRRAKKLLFTLLDQLQLKLSAHKSKMGTLSDFHFLGIQFCVSQNHNAKNPNSQVSTQLHARSCNRALDKVKAMTSDAVHPAHRQSYLSKWSAWWGTIFKQIPISHAMTRYVAHAFALQELSHAWLGRGLLSQRFASYFPRAVRQLESLL